MRIFTNNIFIIALATVRAHHCHLDPITSPAITLNECYIGTPCVLSVVGGTTLQIADLYKTSGDCGPKGCCTTLRDCTL